VNPIKSLGAVALIGTFVTQSSSVSAKSRTTGRGAGPAIYIELKGLLYDSVVLSDFSQKGNFNSLSLVWSHQIYLRIMV